MIEKTIFDYLTSELHDANIPVYMNEPESAPNPSGTQFVVIEKTGSSMTNWVFKATIAIQSYAPTLYGAALLNETIKELMYDAVEIDEVSKVELNSDYNFTDTSTKQPRYQAVFVITHTYTDE